MVETTYLGPRVHVMTRFASPGRAVGAQLRLLFLKFTVMGIFMAAGAAHVFPAEWKELIGPPRSPHFVTFVAPHRSMRSCERKPRFAVVGNGIGRAMKVLDGVAVLAAVLVTRTGELPVVLIFMAVQASRKLDLIYGVLAGRNMALIALNPRVLPLQGVF